MRETGLYDPRHEHDACGVGFVADINGGKSREIIDRSIEVLRNLLHRGAAGGDNETGDGAGILVQMPDEFMRRRCAELGIILPDGGEYGVGMLFMPDEEGLAAKCRETIERTFDEEGLRCLGWRDVPVNPDSLGELAARERPQIQQCFVSWDQPGRVRLERKLYVARRRIERAIDEMAGPEGSDFYIPSLSCRTIVYKGMMMGGQLYDFYEDLQAGDFMSALAIIHQRYSTNTFPSWKLAQPFRYLAHNGEINTLRGNVNQMRAREKLLHDDAFGEDIKKLLPIIDESGSDSACLDNALELLTACGRDLAHSAIMLVPQAWGLKYPIGPDLRGFFDYHAGLMEPWDGPAALAFTDGTRAGALLDRNGLRPARYTVSRDGFMVLASETGVLDIPSSEVREKGALRPGQALIVDLEEKRVKKDAEVKMHYARRQPYRRWVEENKITLRGFFNDVAPVFPDLRNLLERQKLFGYTREDLRKIVGPMAASGHEPVGSMGNDTPLAVLSEKPQLLYAYFKQLFAQVTNPAIDPIREELVMSLMTFMGNPPNILSEEPGHARLIKLRHPVISNDDLHTIRNMALEDFNVVTLGIGFRASGGEKALRESLDSLCERAETAAEGKTLLVLSDRNLDDDEAPIPALLATAAVNQRLVRSGKRTGAGVIVETGEAREVHHLAVLLGYGATAVNPYLAFETVADLAQRGMLEREVSVPKAIENYITALCKGLLKIMSKMGISTLRSYRGAQVFQAIGLNTSIVEEFFPGTSSPVEGIGLEGIARECEERHKAARNPSTRGSRVLESGGRYQYRKDGERHLWTPDSISKLQRATRENDPALFEEYTRLIDDQAEKQSTLRGLLKFRKAEPVPLAEVEPAESIMKRFMTSAMSFGSISREAHETLAVTMNRIGGMSNSGEGGEDPERFKPLPNGDSKCSAIKQIASGRFGVTIEYLANAKELQIKIAQGAKPGEGGQLPGHKVNEEIAQVRHSTPGVTLISPPPHHDIYSIEDIKQLIFDLKNANPDARVSVKLVSEIGVGTVAAGVAKGHADMILISGGDGGTGASPLSSIQHAGAPWELGLSETQQTLVLNGLRGRVRVQADGQMKTGRDIVVAALLGAEEFGFATAPLVVCGCLLLRNCHQNTCSMGIATQDPELRKRFRGKPEYVVNFFIMLAEQIRGYMAELGFRTMDEMVGRSDMLETNTAIDFWKTRGLDYSRILAPVHEEPRRCVDSQVHQIDDVLDIELIKQAGQALEYGRKVEINLPVRNVNRTVGAMLSGRIAKKYGHAGLPEDTIVCNFTGAAGQSFGAFGAHGITMRLEGESNDYLGKGLSGARIIVVPPSDASFDVSNNIICGNVLLYGATYGEVFIMGCAGERFAIRNSGVNAVVEGVGDHGCEYMTGGRVVILGETGVNFAAGMSGGLAYVYDPDGRFDSRCNLAMVDLVVVEDTADKEELRELIEKHVRYTGSEKAAEILADWDSAIASFVKVFPMEYRRALGKMSKEDEAVARENKVNE